MARVVIEHLTKEFGRRAEETVRAVQDLTLTVEEREFLVLVGPSGCGKTTTLRLIAGLEEPTGGTISIDGRAMEGVPPKDRDVAMVFQNYALYPHMTAYENLAFGLMVRKQPRTEIEKRVREAAEMLELTDCLGRLPKALSGGQRQRVAIGRALVRRPKLLLLDEPLSNLDAPLRTQMRSAISRLHRQLGTTMIYVTHDQTEALTLGERIGVMNAGALQQVADPASLYQHPANLFVAGFIGSPPMNLFNGTVRQEGNALFFQEQADGGPEQANLIRVQLAEDSAARLQRYLGKRVWFGLRPENITDKLSTQVTPPEQAVSAVVQMVERVGAENYLYLAGAAQLFVARVSAAEPARVNQTVSLGFDMRAAHFFDPATSRRIN